MVTYVKYVVNGGIIVIRPDFAGCLGCLLGWDLHSILCKTLGWDEER